MTVIKIKYHSFDSVVTHSCNKFQRVDPGRKFDPSDRDLKRSLY